MSVYGFLFLPLGGGGDFKAFGKGFQKEENGKGRKKGKGDFKYLEISKYICIQCPAVASYRCFSRSLPLWRQLEIRIKHNETVIFSESKEYNVYSNCTPHERYRGQ